MAGSAVARKVTGLPDAGADPVAPGVLDLVVAVIDYFEVSRAGLVFGPPSISVDSPSVRASDAWPRDRRLLRLPCGAGARLLMLGGRG